MSEAIKPGLRLAEHTTVSKVTQQTLDLKIVAGGDSMRVQYTALFHSLLSVLSVEVLGGVFFIVTAIFVLQDRSRVEIMWQVRLSRVRLKMKRGSDFSNLFFLSLLCTNYN
jgi:hypothetical protein